MKLEQTIQYMHDFYPMIGYSRKACLNHLFLTLGNGMEWHDGQLVERDFSYYDIDPRTEVMHIGAVHHSGIAYKITPPYVKKAVIDPYHEIVHTNRCLQIDPNYKFRWSGQKDNKIIISASCPSALIEAKSVKVDDDWQAGIDEVYELIKQDGLEIEIV